MTTFWKSYSIKGIKSNINSEQPAGNTAEGTEVTRRGQREVSDLAKAEAAAGLPSVAYTPAITTSIRRRNE